LGYYCPEIFASRQRDYPIVKYKGHNHRLPTSVFQADLNPTNLLVDDKGAFAGVFDFNNG